MNTITVAGITLNVDDLASNTIADLTKVYNNLAGANIKKFTDKKTAVTRLNPLLVPLMRKETRANGSKRRSPLSKHAVINILVDGNPKKPGSKAFDRFAKYRNGMTVGEAHKAGLTFEDFRYDMKRGNISISL